MRRTLIKNMQTPRFTPDVQLDTLGLFCPVPIWETAKAIERMQSGQVIEVISDDEAVQGDMKAWCRQTSNELLNIDIIDGKYSCYVRKK